MIKYNIFFASLTYLSSMLGVFLAPTTHQYFSAAMCILGVICFYVYIEDITKLVTDGIWEAKFETWLQRICLPTALFSMVMAIIVFSFLFNTWDFKYLVSGIGVAIHTIGMFYIFYKV